MVLLWYVRWMGPWGRGRSHLSESWINKTGHKYLGRAEEVQGVHNLFTKQETPPVLPNCCSCIQISHWRFLLLFQCFHSNLPLLFWKAAKAKTINLILQTRKLRPEEKKLIAPKYYTGELTEERTATLVGRGPRLTLSQAAGKSSKPACSAKKPLLNSVTSPTSS